MSCIVIIGLALTGATTVLAYDSPHEGTFSTTTDSCAGCHRAHTATAAKLLVDASQYNLCISCHDGTGADTNVVGGIYLGNTQGNQNTGLRGGGFVTALMDTDADGNMSLADATSTHTVGASSLISWGSGSSGNGEPVSLECGDCHNPHGNSQYRILRPKPMALIDWAVLDSENITAGISDNYTINYDGDNYRDLGDYDTIVQNNIGDWCGQCHTRYPAGAGSEGSTAGGGSGQDTYQAGTDPFFYRHRTEPLTGECLACHVAHGTSANMTGNAAAVNWPDDNGSQAWQTTAGESQYSRLLTIDNRGVCIQCHTGGDLSQN